MDLKYKLFCAFVIRNITYAFDMFIPPELIIIIIKQCKRKMKIIDADSDFIVSYYSQVKKLHMYQITTQTKIKLSLYNNFLSVGVTAENQVIILNISESLDPVRSFEIVDNIPKLNLFLKQNNVCNIRKIFNGKDLHIFLIGYRTAVLWKSRGHSYSRHSIESNFKIITFWQDVRKIVNVNNYMIVLMMDGQVFFCGQCNINHIGLNADSNRNLFTRIPINDVRKIVDDNYIHVVLVTDRGNAYTNYDGELDFTKINLSNVLNVYASEDYFIFLTVYGKIYAVGCNTYDQLGLDTDYDHIDLCDPFRIFGEVTDKEIVSVYPTVYCCIALDSTGMAYVWGDVSEFKQIVGEKLLPAEKYQTPRTFYKF